MSESVYRTPHHDAMVLPWLVRRLKSTQVRLDHLNRRQREFRHGVRALGILRIAFYSRREPSCSSPPHVACATPPHKTTHRSAAPSCGSQRSPRSRRRRRRHATQSTRCATSEARHRNLPVHPARGRREGGKRSKEPTHDEYLGTAGGGMITG